jgi:hypothetical protein
MMVYCQARLEVCVLEQVKAEVNDKAKIQRHNKKKNVLFI